MLWGGAYDGVGAQLCPAHTNVNASMHCQSDVFYVVKIAELLQSPRKCSRVTVLYQEMTVEKEMFLDVEGKQAEKKTIGCQMAGRSIRVMQRLEMYVD